MIRSMQLHRLSDNTQLAYSRAVEGLAKYYRRSPDRIGLDEIKGYLFHQLVERELAWSTCNVTMCGLAFLYTKVLGQEAFRF